MSFDSALAHVPECWSQKFTEHLDPSCIAHVHSFLENEQAAGKRIYPATADIYRALELVPLEQVKVVIIGQDPYHGEGQAHGLSFSVKPGMSIPRSLRNIYKELHSDLGIDHAKHGFLEKWAQQGVLLLNTALTVEECLPASHRKIGWEPITDAIIKIVSLYARPSVFMLWGGDAQAKAPLIDIPRHHIIHSPHPSPFSARRGFFGSRPFSRSNAFLESVGRMSINWMLPERAEEDPTFWDWMARGDGS